MARHLLSNISSAYIEAANRLRPKTRKRKIVAYVESYDDIFFWRDVLLKDYAKGESAAHQWIVDPVPDGKGEFRIGAICTATIKPEAEFAGDAGSDFDISAIDHARGVK